MFFEEDETTRTKMKMVRARRSKVRLFWQQNVQLFFSFLNQIVWKFVRQNKGRYFAVTRNEQSSVHWCQWFFDVNKNNKLTNWQLIELIVNCELWGFLIRFHLYFGFNLMLNMSTKVLPNNRPTFGSLKVFKKVQNRPQEASNLHFLVRFFCNLEQLSQFECH